jgi:RNA polymerase sigma-B factor
LFFDPAGQPVHRQPPFREASSPMPATHRSGGLHRAARRDDPTDGDAAVRYALTRLPEVREEAVEQYRSLVNVVALKMARRGVPVEDLAQVGAIGLIMALERFDPGRGVKFSTYAVNTIVGEIKHFYRDCTWMVKVPRQLQELAVRIQRTNEELVRDLGRPPTLQDLALRLNLSEEAIVEAMELEAVYSPYSLDSQLGLEDAEPHERLNEILGGADAAIERVLDRESLRRALEDLEPRKRRILCLRYFDEWSQSEVGRELGISQMHVSRLEREALTQLRRAIRD